MHPATGRSGSRIAVRQRKIAASRRRSGRPSPVPKRGGPGHPGATQITAEIIPENDRVHNVPEPRPAARNPQETRLKRTHFVVRRNPPRETLFARQSPSSSATGRPVPAGRILSKCAHPRAQIFFQRHCQNRPVSRKNKGVVRRTSISSRSDRPQPASSEMYRWTRWTRPTTCV